MALRKKIQMILAAALALTVLGGCAVAEVPQADTQQDGAVLEGEPAMPTVTPEQVHPLTQDQVTELAKTQISWEYYAVTTEQDPETREWTVTFWSRDRETFQVVIIDQYGSILQVTEGTRWAQG